MKRILTTVVALAAVLSIGTAASAAPYIYNLAGSGTNTTVSNQATTPPSPECGAPYPSAIYCVTSLMASVSSVEIDITDSVVTMTGGNLHLTPSAALFGGAVVISSDIQSTIYGGATGTLVGSDILWSTPAGYSATGTVTCTGGACATLGFTSSTITLAQFNALPAINASTLPALLLGVWDLSDDLSSILGSTRAVTTIANASQAPSSWVRFGSADLGFPVPVPEPGSLALVLLGLGGLALRSREA